MPEILIASLSPAGHIAPLLNVAQGLVDRGDRVTVLSSAAHAALDADAMTQMHNLFVVTSRR